jgi:hypothetical protein
MLNTPTLHHHNIPLDSAHIEFEDDGVYRITKRSLTGMGTHTKWFYPESPGSEGSDKAKTASDEDSKRVVSVDGCSSFNSCIDGTLSIISSRATTLDTEVMGIVDGEGFDDFQVDDVDSDTTEIVDEDLEATRSRLKEELLPDLPYERIMIRISQEPTLILEDCI